MNWPSNACTLSEEEKKMKGRKGKYDIESNMTIGKRGREERGDYICMI